jgi:hypothetical protein
MHRNVREGPARQGTPHLVGWVLPLISAIMSTTGATYAGALLPLDPAENPDRNLHLALWVLIALLGLVLLAATQFLASRREKQRNIEVVKFNNALSGLHDALADLVKSDKDMDARREFFRAAVRQGTSLLPFDGVRVCVYELDAKEEEDTEDESRYLKLVEFSGRPDSPRPAFMPDTSHGWALIEAALNQTQVTVSDRKNTSVPIDYNDGTVWRSYFVVPLVDSSHRSRGVLTVDTQDPARFSILDVTVARTLARLIVIGMDELYGAAKNPGPEVSGVEAKLKELRVQDEAPLADAGDQKDGERK